MSSPSTARHGVWAGEVGMLLAIGGTLLHHGIVDYKWIAIALVLGSIIGVPLGMVQMTAVPQRTALSHAFGALCVTLVGTAEFYLRAPNVPPFMMAVLSAGSDSRLAHVYRQSDGGREARRKFCRSGRSLIRDRTSSIFRCLASQSRSAVVLVMHPGAHASFSSDSSESRCCSEC